MIIFIVPEGANVYKIIAGEMLNIELSALRFVDGEQVDNVVNGYPRIAHDGKLDIFRATSGYIYVPMGTDIDDFKCRLVEALAPLEAPLDLFTAYSTMFVNYCTNIKGVSDNTNKTAISDEDTKPHKKLCRRLFTGCLGLCTTPARFIWCIVPINHFDPEISSANLEDPISRHVSSIFWDRDNICSMPHNTVTFEFSTNMLTGYRQIYDEHFTLTTKGHPLTIELSDYWANNTPSVKASKYLRDVPVDLYVGDYKAFDLQPVTSWEDDTVMPGYVCVACRSRLWGDNYVISKRAYLPAAMCPMCFHSIPLESKLVSSPSCVYRVTFPIGVGDMMIAKGVPAAKRDLYEEVLRGFKIRKTMIGDTKCIYVLIGDRYAAFEDINDYLYTRLSTDPELLGRKILTVDLIR